ncbi:ABC-type transport system permease protein [Fictibacillus macauensis ZFHKF-1]|uniref:ABC-type transport system permease protein n=1 Tax=Fictibacillus macauensis ZFHKF-1 TaxID=1196324 RepID=I8J3K8_9BACL|nr:ABC transporter permease subunit [Fictibacillus macauensis]EIT86361.1 ABC-type transport system permease protein [Fictibacillus macauensis ZFHKF-1]
MSNFWGLIRNENMKIYRKPGTFVMMGILVALVLITAFLFKNIVDETVTGNWKQKLQTENVQLQKEIKKEAKSNPGIVKYNTEKIEINKYRIKHNYQPIRSVADYLQKSTSMVSIIVILTLIVAGGSVAGEFSAGTIKMLLIRPSSRTMILLSKFIAVILFAIVLLLLNFVASFIIGGLVYGFEGASQPILEYVNGHVETMNVFGEIWKQYGYGCIELIIMATFAFMLSVMFRNSSLAIAASIILSMSGSIIMSFISKYSWSKYVLFANTDLTMYTAGRTPLVKGMTLNFSIAVLLVYFIVFTVLTVVVFKKRDVAA